MSVVIFGGHGILLALGFCPGRTEQAAKNRSVLAQRCDVAHRKQMTTAPRQPVRGAGHAFALATHGLGHRKKSRRPKRAVPRTRSGVLVGEARPMICRSAANLFGVRRVCRSPF